MSTVSFPFVPVSFLGVALAGLLLVSACVRTREPDADHGPPPSERVHIFYYNWYGSPPREPRYRHWDQAGHAGPDDIASNYYPLLGPYDSSDPQVLRQHIQWIRQARVGVLVLSWWGRDSYEDRGAARVLDAAAEAGLKVAFHLEPYAGSTPATFAADVRYLLGRFGEHRALYRVQTAAHRPLFYIFEALRHKPAAWRAAIAALRKTPQDSLLIAQTSDLAFIQEGDFDGGYTYDVLTPFGDTARHGRLLATLARDFAQAGKLFIPSVGPGYVDSRAVPSAPARPAAAVTRDAGTAATYQVTFRAAIAAEVPLISITSFNEWHEGTQIEPAIAHDAATYHYAPYAGGPTDYLKRTADLVATFVAAPPAKSPEGTVP